MLHICTRMRFDDPPLLHRLPMRAGGVTVQMLGGEGVALSPDAQQLKDWVEKGAQRSCLACLLAQCEARHI